MIGLKKFLKYFLNYFKNKKNFLTYFLAIVISIAILAVIINFVTNEDDVTFYDSGVVFFGTMAIIIYPLLPIISIILGYRLSKFRQEIDKFSYSDLKNNEKYYTNSQNKRSEITKNIEFVKHNSIKIKGSKIIYIDPYEIEKEYRDADYIFCTHSHYDHFSLADINKVMKDTTKIITVKDAKLEAKRLINNVMIVEPDKEYSIDDISFKTTFAYNENKKFHLKENGWVGFVINLDGVEYFVAGDTDNIPEIRNIKCDVALLPVGGTYTMNVEEAAELANVIDAKVVVPTHYGVIVGNEDDGKKIAELVKNKKVEII